MKELNRQDIVEAVIIRGPITANQLSLDLDCYVDEIYEALEAMESDGLIRRAIYDPEEEEDQESAEPVEPVSYEAADFDEWEWSDLWTYCGGPISQALAPTVETAAGSLLTTTPF
jgi:hypothetical protein